MKFKILNSTLIYEGRVFSVRQENVLLPDGKSANLDIVHHDAAVVIVPIDEDGNIWFVEQYRHPAAKSLVELPAGGLNPGEDPKACALRELREETGLGARSLNKIGAFYLAPGYSTEYLYIFLAKDLYPAPLNGDEDEFLEPKTIPLDRVFELAQKGFFEDAKTLAALLLAKNELN